MCLTYHIRMKRLPATAREDDLLAYVYAAVPVFKTELGSRVTDTIDEWVNARLAEYDE